MKETDGEDGSLPGLLTADVLTVSSYYRIYARLAAVSTIILTCGAQ